MCERKLFILEDNITDGVGPPVTLHTVHHHLSNSVLSFDGLAAALEENRNRQTFESYHAPTQNMARLRWWIPVSYTHLTLPTILRV